MKRLSSTPRPDWQKALVDTGRMQDGGWDESARYQFTPMEIRELQMATKEIQMLAMQAARHVISNDLYDALAIPPEWIELIKNSWKRRDPYILGRLDFAYDGVQPPKLIEYNGDVSTLLIETAWSQKEWALAIFPDAPHDQCSDLQDLLPKRWEETHTGQHIHFSCLVDDKEALSNTIYMREMAILGGCTTTDIDVKDIGWDSATRKFVDLENKQIETLAKHYPWDWMLKETFGKHFGNPVKVVEPAWKMMLNSKGILAILWKLFPNHPNLLPAADNYIPVGQDFVKKPLWGRAGLNISIHRGAAVQQTAGHLETEKFVYQGIAPIPNFNGRYPIVSSFIVGDKPAGVGVREDGNLISTKSAVFVPHTVYAE